MSWFDDPIGPAMKPDNPEAVLLYSVAQSMYTGRARSYMIKQGIPYEERAPQPYLYQLGKKWADFLCQLLSFQTEG